MKIVSASPESLVRAAEVIRDGGVVILPTETVYGIACDATNSRAVARVFAVKGRPSTNPMIVHVSSMTQAQGLARDWPNTADLLANAFWPGPLTLVVEQSVEVSSPAAAGLDTVAIRMPNNLVFLEVINLAGVPLAAPSANPYMLLSPTRVEHLDPKLIDQVDLVVDGGPCRVGIESSVVDVTSSHSKLLRPGGISREQIERVLQRELLSAPEGETIRSPGMHRRHYAPKSKLVIVEKLEQSQAGLTFGEPQSSQQYRMSPLPDEFGANLYNALHQIDKGHPGTIFVEAPPREPEWEAVWDRLKRASEEL